MTHFRAQALARWQLENPLILIPPELLPEGEGAVLAAWSLRILGAVEAAWRVDRAPEPEELARLSEARQNWRGPLRGDFVRLLARMLGSARPVVCADAAYAAWQVAGRAWGAARADVPHLRALADELPSEWWSGAFGTFRLAGPQPYWDARVDAGHRPVHIAETLLWAQVFLGVGTVPLLGYEWVPGGPMVPLAQVRPVLDRWAYVRLSSDWEFLDPWEARPHFAPLGRARLGNLLPLRGRNLSEYGLPPVPGG